MDDRSVERSDDSLGIEMWNIQSSVQRYRTCVCYCTYSGHVYTSTAPTFLRLDLLSVFYHLTASLLGSQFSHSSVWVVRLWQAVENKNARNIYFLKTPSAMRRRDWPFASFPNLLFPLLEQTAIVLPSLPHTCKRSCFVYESVFIDYVYISIWKETWTFFLWGNWRCRELLQVLVINLMAKRLVPVDGASLITLGQTPGKIVAGSRLLFYH